MAFLTTQHQRKSAVITAVLVIALLFVVFNFGMRYFDPPQEYGLAINFGDSNVGFGGPVEDVKQSPTENETLDKVQEEVTETTKEDVKENIISDETSKEVMVVEKKETKKEPLKEVVKKEVQKEEPKKPSKEAQDALNSLLNNNTTDGKQKGEGDDTKNGVKGTDKGDPNSKNYYGINNSDGGNYSLGDRNALLKPKPITDCQEEGKVVVEIQVDRNGKVVSVNPGVKGSDNTAQCLLRAAKEAALKTTWEPDNKANSTQKGFIIYKFTLSK